MKQEIQLEQIINILPSIPCKRILKKRKRYTTTWSSAKRNCVQIHYHTKHYIEQIARKYNILDSCMETFVYNIWRYFGTHQLDILQLSECFHERSNIVIVLGQLILEEMDPTCKILNMKRLPKFLKHVITRYHNTNAFHNAIHAIDVMHTLYTILKASPVVSKRISLVNQLAVLVAAILHDIEHIGLANDFIQEIQHPIAKKYPTKSPLESMHADIAVSIIENTKYNIFGELVPHEKDQVIKIIRECILSTSLGAQATLLQDLKNMSEQHPEDTENISILSQELQLVALRGALHVSDIGQSMKDISIHKKWVMKLIEEGLKQGDMEIQLNGQTKRLNTNRFQFCKDQFLTDQIKFLQALALPAVQTFNTIAWFEATELVDGIKANISYWTTLLEAV